MQDPYQSLGVSRTASAAEIKSAYRKLAKKYHPDVNQGRKDIEHKFKEISAAYDLLSDPAKRVRFDRGEIDAAGNPRAYGFSGGDPFAGMGRGSARGRSYGSSGGNPFSGFNPEDIFAEFFGGHHPFSGHRERANAWEDGGTSSGQARGQDVTYTLKVPFTEACLGGKRRVTLSSGKTVDVNIPAGIDTGHKLRLRGQGAKGAREAGDAIVEIEIEPHAFFTRAGYDVHLEAPVSLVEAVSGATINVPTLDGYVTMKVPAWANAGTVLRLKGKGVPRPQGQRGDMLVKLKIVLPDQPDDDLSALIEKWAKKNGYNPRKKLGW